MNFKKECERVIKPKKDFGCIHTYKDMESCSECSPRNKICDEWQAYHTQRVKDLMQPIMDVYEIYKRSESVMCDSLLYFPRKITSLRSAYHDMIKLCNFKSYILL